MSANLLEDFSLINFYSFSIGGLGLLKERTTYSLSFRVTTVALIRLMLACFNPKVSVCSLTFNITRLYSAFSVALMRSSWYIKSVKFSKAG